jgi:hypothetical protein
MRLHLRGSPWQVFEAFIRLVVIATVRIAGVIGITSRFISYAKHGA